MQVQPPTRPQDEHAGRNRQGTLGVVRREHRGEAGRCPVRSEPMHLLDHRAVGLDRDARQLHGAVVVALPVGLDQWLGMDDRGEDLVSSGLDDAQDLPPGDGLRVNPAGLVMVLAHRYDLTTVRGDGTA